MTHSYPPVGLCIYCGATEYVPGTGRQLATEHVIPYSLGGDILLPEASCQACERVTGRIESIGVNAHLLGPRRSMGLHSRTPKAKRKPQVLTVIRGGRHEIIEVPDERYPSVLFLPYLNEAPILRELPYRGHPNDLHLGYYHHFFDDNARALLEEFDADGLASPKIDTLIWRRIIAKVAHATAVAELGVGAFTPLLANILRDPDRNSYEVQDYVGGTAFGPEVRAGHRMNIGREVINGTVLFVATITLFDVLDAPSYRVAVGYEVGAAPPILPRKRPVIFDLRQQWQPMQN